MRCASIPSRFIRVQGLDLMTYMVLLHMLAVVVWVGGMFFAHVVLRPAVAATLEPPQRLALMTATLVSFFPWVMVAIVVLLATGFAMIVGLGGFRAVGPPIHAMAGIGLVMAAIFVELRLGPFRRLRTAVAATAWPDAASALGAVRLRVVTNLVLGLATIAIAVVGRSVV
jgi:uncharacterized membrane protein